MTKEDLETVRELAADLESYLANVGGGDALSLAMELVTVLDNEQPDS